MLTSCDHPNIIKLYFAFTDKRRLYFIIQYAPNGELYDLLARHSTFIFIIFNLDEGTLTYELAQFYLAEIVLVLEYLHKKGISHRDLKPENLLINENYHLILVRKSF